MRPHLPLCWLACLVLIVCAPARAQTERPMPRADRPLATRQVHLDFHTSGLIEGIGARFDRAQWQEALQIGHINSINIFGKGHHGWSYYPTGVGTRHPHLDFDLLGAQIEACHEIGVECPIYFTVGWSVNDAETHPEWCARRRDGSFVWPGKVDAQPTDPYPFGAWKLLCPSGEYHELIKKQIIELCTRYPVIDGFWFDIYQVHHGCWCERCLASMKEQGIDSDDDEAVIGHFAGVYKRHMADLRQTIAQYHPHALVFFNGTNAIRSGNQTHQVYEYNTHQDLEDLPTGWGGYDKFPFRSKFYLGQGDQICAMSGKFHTSWGEFGGFKHRDALRYEAASMVAFGAACNFGDQLHPSGAMDLQTYRNIGAAYEYVQRIEQYGPGGVPTSNLGLWFTDQTVSDEGAGKMLLELHRDFLVANEHNLDQFDVIVIPSNPCLNESQAAAVRRFITRGGGVLALAGGAMNATWNQFVIPVGATYEGPARFDIDYTRVAPDLGPDLIQSPVLNYTPAIRVKPDEGTTVLASIHEPYFSRTYEHYSSHRNTPYQLEPASHPALIQNGRVILSAHPLDQMYNNVAARAHRDLFARALDRIHTQPTLQVELPSSGRVSLLRQADHHRYVAHLLYASPHYRGGLELIEDLPTIADVPVALRVDREIKKATLIPDGTELPIDRQDGVVRVVVPKFRMHCAVVFEY